MKNRIPTNTSTEEGQSLTESTNIRELPELISILSLGQSLGSVSLEINNTEYIIPRIAVILAACSRRK